MGVLLGPRGVRLRSVLPGIALRPVTTNRPDLDADVPRSTPGIRRQRHRQWRIRGAAAVPSQSVVPRRGTVFVA